MRLSEYKAGTILVDGDNKVFIHDGFVNADGYGVIIGEDSDGMIQKSNGIGNFIQPDDRQELHCCIDGSAQIFP